MITSLYAGLLGALYVRLSIDTIIQRRKHAVSLGVGKKGEIASVVSAHDNFAAYVVFLLFLLYLLEVSAVPAVVVHVIGAAFFVGRVCHYKAFVGERMNFKLRKIGMHLTLWPMLALAVANILLYVRGFFE